MLQRQFSRVTSPFLRKKVLLRGQNYDLWDSQWSVFIGARYFVAEKVCKSSAHDATLKIRVILSPLQMTHEFKPTECYATRCGVEILSPQRNVFAKTGMLHEENSRCNMSPLHVPATCSLVCVGFIHYKRHTNIRSARVACVL